MSVHRRGYWFLAILVVFFCMAAACSDSNANNTENEEPLAQKGDTATYTPLSDTLSVALGRYNGYNILKQLNYFKATEDSTYNVSDFSRGLGLVLDRRHPFMFISAVMLGMNMDHDMRQLEDSGMVINRVAMIERIKNGLSNNTAGIQQRTQNVADRYMAVVDKLEKEGKAVYPVLQDSLQNLYAQYISLNISSEIADYTRDNDRTFDSGVFFDGLTAIFSKRFSPEYIAGVAQGVDLATQLIGFEAEVVNVRRDVMLKEMQAIINNGVENYDEAVKAYDIIKDIQNRVARQKYEREELELSKTDLALQNIKTGEALVNKMKAETPDAKTTPSGLTYVIYRNPSSERITDTDTFTMKYVGSHLDGKVFDIDQAATMTTQGMISGLEEGLKMLGKGAKATFWIPGKLGYRGHGVEQFQIGPMETIVFDVEILDVKK